MACETNVNGAAAEMFKLTLSPEVEAAFRALPSPPAPKRILGWTALVDSTSRDKPQPDNDVSTHIVATDASGTRASGAAY
jgi:hypothetical protein